MQTSPLSSWREARQERLGPSPPPFFPPPPPPDRINHGEASTHCPFVTRDVALDDRRHQQSIRCTNGAIDLNKNWSAIDHAGSCVT
jgi:hypothetical protein